MSVVKEYFILSNQWIQKYGMRTIVLMQIGSFMECYGKKEKREILEVGNILELSRICDLAIVEKNPHIETIEDTRIVMAGFKDTMIDKYIKKIVNAGYTCVVYMQDEPPKNQSIKITTRSLARIFSPGTYMTGENIQLNNNLTCIWIDYSEKSCFSQNNQITVGVSNIDIFTGSTTLFQFTESYINKPTTFDELERFISIYNPSETIIISNMKLKDINTIIQYAGINSPLIHKYELDTATDDVRTMLGNCEKQIYQREILSKFYSHFTNSESYYTPFYECAIASQSFCFLLEFAHQHNPHIVEKITEPAFENHSNRLHLANYSLRQLNIIDQPNTGGGGKYSCVSKMLNQAVTPMGKRKFNEMLFHPITNVDALTNEYNIVEYCLEEYHNLEKYVAPQLSCIRDVSKIFRFMTHRRTSPSHFFQLFDTLQYIEEIICYIKTDKTLTDYFDNLQKDVIVVEKTCKDMSQFIRKHFDLDVAKTMETQQLDSNFINKQINIKLDKMTETLQNDNDKLESIREYFNVLLERKEKKSAPKKQEYFKVHVTEKTHLTLIGTEKRCELLKSCFGDNEEIVKLSLKDNQLYNFTMSNKLLNFHKQNSSGNTFLHPEINDVCKSIFLIKTNMKEVINETFQNIIQNFINTYEEQLHTIIDVVSTIDILLCKAKLARIYNLSKPVIDKSTTKSFVDAKELRHILIEHILQDELYVSNDVTLGKAETNGMLIYGTNAVGKTCLIKAVGIAIIMAQAGLYVPAKKFEYHPYQYLFTRILGNDNLFKGLSTFAVEMSELRTILKLSNENSIVLGDELCSGTEISSATCIFVTGLQQLVNNNSSFMFATHLHEIVDYDEINQMKSLIIKHMAVVFNKESDTLVYDRKLKDGPGNNMYGLEVCKSMNLPDAFISAAYKLRTKYSTGCDSILSLKTSKYNAKKLIAYCEICKVVIGSEIHHLEYQKNANEQGIIETDQHTFHKNSLPNLITLCEKCHTEIHKSKLKPVRKKTIGHGTTLVNNPDAPK